MYFLSDFGITLGKYREINGNYTGKEIMFVSVTSVQVKIYWEINVLLNFISGTTNQFHECMVSS